MPRRDMRRFQEAMVGLSWALSSRPIRAETREGEVVMSQWDSDLRGFSDDEVFAAIAEARRTLAYMPKPAQLIRLCLLERARLQRMLSPRGEKPDLDRCPHCGSGYKVGRTWRDGTRAGRVYCDCDWAIVEKLYHQPPQPGKMPDVAFSTAAGVEMGDAWKAPE